MSERRLTEEEIDILNESELSALERSSGDDCDMAAVKCVVRELRQRRSEDLTGEEREALCICADIVRETLRQRTPWPNPSSYRQYDENNAHARVSRALAILDKLLGGAR